MKPLGAIGRVFRSIGGAAAPAGAAVQIVEVTVGGLATLGIAVAPALVAAAAGSLCLIACGCSVYDRFVREPRRAQSAKESKDLVDETRRLMVESLSEKQDAAAQRGALARVLGERATEIGTTIEELRKNDPTHPLAAMRDLVDCLGPDAPGDATSLARVLQENPEIHSALAVYIEREFDTLRALCGVTIDELRHLRAETATAVASLRMDIQKEIKQEADRIITKLGARPHLDSMLLEADGNPLYYAAQRVPFLGRVRERRVLREFLSARRGPDKAKERDFWWMFLMGSGGAGKSRTAFELCLEAQEMGWDAGFLRGEFNDWHRWRVTRPTLVVIDYAAEQAERVAGALAALAQRADFDGVAVRFLLLERTKSDAWWRRFWSDDEGRDGKLQASAWRDAPAVEPEALDALKAETLQDVMEWVIWDVAERVRRERRDAEAGARSEGDAAGRGRRLASLDAWDGMRSDEGKRAAWRERTRARLRKIDPEGLPLLAAVAAEAMFEGGELELRNLSKRDLIDRILDREARHWRKRGVDERHANLLALATMTGGVSIGAAAAPGSAEEELAKAGVVPAPEQVNLDQRHDMCTLSAPGKRADEKQIPPMEPDILGEAFVLGRIGNRRGLWLDEGRNAEARKPCVVETRALIRGAWASSPFAMFAFALRAVRDFPEAPEVLELFPSPLEEPGDSVAGEAGARAGWMAVYTATLVEAAGALGTGGHGTRDALIGLLERFATSPSLAQPRRADATNDLAAAYMNRGNAHLNSGNLPAAVEDYGRAIELHARNREILEPGGAWYGPFRVELAKSLLLRGVARGAQGDTRGACEDFRAAAAIKELPAELEAAAKEGIRLARGEGGG